MTLPASFGIRVLIAAVALAMVAGWYRQWRETMALRLERDLMQLDAAELPTLRQENHRLRATQLSTTELERLRADHAALPRLRAELEALQRAERNSASSR